MNLQSKFAYCITIKTLIIAGGVAGGGGDGGGGGIKRDTLDDLWRNGLPKMSVIVTYVRETQMPQAATKSTYNVRLKIPMC